MTSTATSCAPRLLHLGQVCADLTLSVKRLPARGTDLFADSHGLSAGGGFNVLYAARKMGAQATYEGAIGTGPIADMVQEALSGIGVPCHGAEIADIDTGVSIAMTEPDGERTFVSTRGAETMVPTDSYENLDLMPEDMVYMSGYSLAHTDNALAIRRFAGRFADLYDSWRAQGKGQVLFDPSPIIGEVSDENLEAVRRLHPIWSMNQRESEILTDRFGLLGSDQNGSHRPTDASNPRSDSAQTRCKALADHLSDAVIVRTGAQGAWLCEHADTGTTDTGTTDARTSGPIRIPTLSVHQVDSNGAGDTHAGVLCAALLEGRSICDAIRLANCAASLSVTQQGPATCPSRKRIEASLAMLK